MSAVSILCLYHSQHSVTLTDYWTAQFIWSLEGYSRDETFTRLILKDMQPHYQYLQSPEFTQIFSHGVYSMLDTVYIMFIDFITLLNWLLSHF